MDAITIDLEVPGADKTPGSMAVFQYDKSLLTRLQECSDVLQASKIPVPAAKIRAEWSYFVEVQIEPAGWLLIRT